MLLKKLLTEFLGTFFLTTAIVSTGNPLAIGLMLAAFIYIGGHISGAHYNPAVSFVMLLLKKISSLEFALYVFVQFAGASIAAAAFYQTTGNLGMVAPKAGELANLTYEALGTFTLISVILAMTSAQALKGNFIYGFVIGSTLAAIAYSFGPISGGGFNPAVALGINWVATSYQGSAPMHSLLYAFGPLIGGALAAGFYKVNL